MASRSRFLASYLPWSHFCARRSIVACPPWMHPFFKMQDPSIVTTLCRFPSRSPNATCFASGILSQTSVGPTAYRMAASTDASNCTQSSTGLQVPPKFRSRSSTREALMLSSGMNVMGGSRCSFRKLMHSRPQAEVSTTMDSMSFPMATVTAVWYFLSGIRHSSWIFPLTPGYSCRICSSASALRRSRPDSSLSQRRFDSAVATCASCSSRPCRSTSRAAVLSASLAASCLSCSSSAAFALLSTTRFSRRSRMVATTSCRYFWRPSSCSFLVSNDFSCWASIFFCLLRVVISCPTVVVRVVASCLSCFHSWY
mmetsp:Transcript_142406/g.248357  ORF Transcript_142406/g.248357 Transcript_142406/m.248357 type:complete len:312 (+) Transcript_142406:3467-4402(+)